MKYTAVIALGLAAAASARPMRRQTPTLAAGQAAVALNNQFASLTTASACTEPQDACVNGKFAQCVSGTYVLQACGAGTICAALPTTQDAPLVTCTTQADLTERLAATGVSPGDITTTTNTTVTSSSSTSSSSNASSSSTSTGSATTSSTATSSASNSTETSASSSSNSTDTNDSSSGVAVAGAAASSTDLQNSTTLDPSQVASGFLQNGQAVQEAGQVASLTSDNNFINFCATQSFPITNGLQIATGSCNPAIMGVIPSIQNMPSAAFEFPTNLATIQANTAFNVTMNIANLETGNFVNADTNYFAAPQQTNAQGQIIGHSHVVIEAIAGFNDTKTTDPEVFAFFKGLNAAAVNGQLTATVANGLPAGTYRLSSINTAANHQPALVPIAQHGAIDHMVYFTVTD